MFAKTCCAALFGVDVIPVTVEVDIARGLPVFQIVGLPETAVRESRDRIRTALRNKSYGFPKGRITVNLSPANIKKEGSGFDLAIALGILAASGLLPKEKLESCLALGELSLDGRINPVKGALTVVSLADPDKIKSIFVPEKNAAELSFYNKIPVYAVSELERAVDHISGKKELSPVESMDFSSLPDREEEADLKDVAGQEHAKRALEVAAAGNHNLLMFGPPGSGKTMLARRLPGILPPLSFEEALEISRIYSAAGLLDADSSFISKRPFRAPHHSISDAGLIGGGSYPKPGEISLAHNGVLFLDEFPEFRKKNLDMLRQPLEDRLLTISRASISLSFPASIMLVAAMNPCPCGYAGSMDKSCICTSASIRRYRSKISGPLMDRMDIQIEVPSLSYEELRLKSERESSLKVAERVLLARKRQEKRFFGTKILNNAAMEAKDIKKFCLLDNEGELLLKQAVNSSYLSARGVARVLKIARSIADIEGFENIRSEHLAEAIQYRRVGV